jgi:tRNA G18 (ribose-2'-O)-methylase SpoU
MRELVTDVEDPRLADYARLTDMELRTSLESAMGLFIAEGAKVISRAVAAGYPVRSMLLAERRLGDLPALPATGAPVYVVPDETAERLTGYRVHRGALASLYRRPLPRAAALAAAARRVIVLEDLVDHANVGGIFRCAAALGVDTDEVIPPHSPEVALLLEICRSAANPDDESDSVKHWRVSLGLSGLSVAKQWQGSVEHLELTIS